MKTIAPIRGVTQSTFSQTSHPAGTEKFTSDIYTSLIHFITQYCPYPEPVQYAFSVFFANLHADHFNFNPIDENEMLGTLNLLLNREDIPLEKRIAAVSHLAAELSSPVGIAGEFLCATVQQLQWALLMDLEAILPIQEQAVLQAAGAFNNEGPPQHTDTYHQYLRRCYGLPSEPLGYYEGMPDQKALLACWCYAQARITPYFIIDKMAAAYLEAITLPIGMAYEDACQYLAGLKPVLTQKYGDIPNDILLEQRDDQYYITRSPTLIKVALIQTFQARGILLAEDSIALYTLPPSQTTGQEPLAPANAIYQTGTVYWVQMQAGPELLTLDHLQLLLPELTTILPEALLDEALHNSSEEAVCRTLHYNQILVVYLCKRFSTRKTELLYILLSLFSRKNPTMEHLSKILPKLLSPAMVTSLKQMVSSEYVLTQLVTVIQRLFSEVHFEMINTEQQLINLLQADLNPACTDIEDRSLLAYAAQRGWLAATSQLIGLGMPAGHMDKQGRTVLDMAIDNGRIAIIKALWHSPGSTLTPQHFEAALFHAIEQGDILMIKTLLNLKNRPLIAARKLFPDLEVEQACGINVNARDPSTGQTPLHSLFNARFPDSIGQITREIFRLLAAEGVDIHLLTYSGASIFSYPRVFMTDCFELLLFMGGKLSEDAPYPALYAAIEAGNERNLKKLTQLQITAYARQPVTLLEGLINMTFLQGKLIIARTLLITLLLAHKPHMLPHSTRATIIHWLNTFLQENVIRQTTASRIFDQILAPAILSQPDSLGYTFLDGLCLYYQSYRQSLCSEHIVTQLGTVAQYINLHSLSRAGGESLLSYLLKYYQEDSLFTDTIIHLWGYPDEEGQTPQARLLKTAASMQNSHRSSG